MGVKKDPSQMSNEELEDRVVRLAFDGDRLLFKEFVARL